MTTLVQYPSGKNGSFTTPDTVNTIEWDAFYCCTGLTSMSLSNSVTDIVQGAFWGCSNLTSVLIPASVTHIGAYLFWSCTSLKQVEVQWPTPLPISEIFNDVDLKSATLYVPAGTKALYQAAAVWKDFGTVVEQ
jgi:hypothetical protein